MDKLREKARDNSPCVLVPHVMGFALRSDDSPSALLGPFDLLPETVRVVDT